MTRNQQPASFGNDYVKKVTEIRSLSTQNLIFDLILPKLGNKFKSLATL
jgi:hypothetical protein